MTKNKEGRRQKENWVKFPSVICDMISKCQSMWSSQIMIVRIRQFCCALTTFVRLVSVFFLVFHILLAIAATIWYSLRHLQKNQEETAENDLPSGEVDDRTFDTFLIGSEKESNKDSKSPEESSQFDLIIGKFQRNKKLQKNSMFWM